MMAGEDTGDTWYVRARGRVLGPLSWAQLQALRERGQLARFDQVSRDRQSWAPADSLERLFPRGGSGGAFVAGTGARTISERPKRRPVQEPEPEPDGFLILDDDAGGSGPDLRTAGPASDEPTGWYYAEAGVPQGPVDYPDLRRLAKDGRIGPDTLYWRSGLEQWTSGSDLRELDRLWPFDDGNRGAATSATPPARGAGDEPGRPLAAPRREPLAIISVASNVFCGIGNLAAVVIGIVALVRIARSKEPVGGKGLAVVGLAVGAAGLVACALVYSRLFANGGENVGP